MLMVRPWVSDNACDKNSYVLKIKTIHTLL